MFKSFDEDPLENSEEGLTGDSRFFRFLIFGFVMISVGLTIVVIAALLDGSSLSGGGVIFIGPFPIVFGAGPDAAWLIAISLFLAILLLAVFWIMNRKVGKRFG